MRGSPEGHRGGFQHRDYSNQGETSHYGHQYQGNGRGNVEKRRSERRI